VKWLSLIGLATIAGLLLVQLAADGPIARGQVTAAEEGGVFAVAGQITSDSFGIYLVDTERQTLTVYQWLPSVKKLRLLAARNYRFDLGLDEFNTEPSVREIQQLTREHRNTSAE